ncbi:MAG: hypothetical protein ACRCZF_26320 [Gemmataceae bacterium]
MNRSRRILVGILALAGCNPAPAPQPVVVPVVAEVPEPVTTPAPTTPAAPSNKPVEVPKPVAEPFRLPTDLGGQLLSRQITPMPPQVPEVPRIVKPQSRTSAVLQGELSWPLAMPTERNLPLIPRKPGQPSAPPEPVPSHLGGVPIRTPVAVVLPIYPTEVFRTAAIPDWQLPLLAQPRQERIPTDDPTIELSMLRIIETPLVLPAVLVPYRPQKLPDPYELAGHLPLLPPGVEPGLAPVTGRR